MKLTDTSIARLTLPAGASDKIVFDDDLPGFGLRLRAGGSRKFVVHYRIAGSQRRHTLGSASVLKVEEARRKARKLLVAVDDGKDPAADKATQRANSAVTFGATKVEYLETREDDTKPSYYVDLDRHLTRYFAPLDRLALTAISRATVATELRSIGKAHGPGAADRARASLSGFFAWCIGEGLCDSNPVTGTNKQAEPTSRERVLTDAELVAVWNAAHEATPDSEDYGDIVRLLILTAQRREEIGGLERSEIVRGDKPLIALPGARTKNSQDHDVPLSAAALSIVDAACERQERRWVFGTGKAGHTTWSKPKAALDSASGITGWTLHDLRRTAATRMGDLGVLPHVIEAILNHTSGHKAGVAGVYNRATYAAEKRAALDLWASHVAVLLAKADGGNVVTIRPAALRERAS